MSEKRILEILGEVEDGYIEEANPLNHKKKVSFNKIRWMAVAACICLLVVVGYGVSLQMSKEPFVAFDINKEEAIATIPYGNSNIYLFPKEVEEESEYSFEAVMEYEGVYYKASIDINNEERIFEMFDTILGEAQSHLFESVLGYDSYYVIAEEVWNGFVNWKYYVEIDGAEICLAEVFGYTSSKPQVYQNDLDGDGVAELICNSMYGTGAARVYIFRNHNGAIEVGYLCYDLYDESRFPGITNRGSSYIQESYHPENQTFVISYPIEDGTKSVILEDMKWVEFVPFEKGYF
ncbi:MAG: hypothetical protein IJ958_03055 [Agathobacter sp.]|nr:hypothetical protein [Agathobacter sp.]